MSAIEHRRTRVPGLIDSKALPAFPQITNLVLHVDMSEGLWQDAAKTTAAGNGDAVYTWEDLSGNGHDFIQATAANRPIMRTDVSGTIDALEFDGSNDYLSQAAVLFGNSTATVFIVCYLSSASQKGAMLGVGSNSTGWKVGVGASNFDGDGNDLIILFDQVKWVDTNDLIGTGVHLLTVRLTSGAPEWWIDGVASGSATGSPSGALAATVMGADGVGTGRYYTDYLIELVASSSAISDAERGQMETFLMDRYGI